ncbi:MAG: glycosyltransferase family 2 protein [Clostridiales bacterium]
MENKIKVSVIMPVYNSGEYLQTAVDSILSQSLKDIELILVDDGSTDGSSEKCDEYAKKDKRVVVIHQKNGGICNARNAALKVARGEYIGFSDHDDEYVPGYLEHAYNDAILNNADLVKVGKREYIIQGGKVLRTKQSNLPSRVYHQEDIKNEYFELVDSDELDCLWDALFRRSIIFNNGVWLDERFRNGGEDIDFIQRILRYTNTFVTINKIYYKHYIRKGFSTSAKFNPEKIQAKKIIIFDIENNIKYWSIDLNKYKFDYTYLLLRQYIAPICSLYSNDGCTLSLKEKKEKIHAIKTESFFFDFCNRQDIRKFFKKSKKYGLLYFLLFLWFNIKNVFKKK